VTSDNDIRAGYYCVAEVIRERRRRGQPVPSWLVQHHIRLEKQFRVSQLGHETTSARAELGDDVPITATEAAELLRCSRRHVQRLAADLDGKIVGGRWLFSRAAVVDYAEGKADDA
jgi:excisionase family DNA binding protein